MRSRSTQISRSSTPRTTRGEGWLHDLTGPACPPTSAAHRIPTPPALAAPTPVRTNTSMHGSAEGQSGLKGTYSARKRFPNTRYAVSVASRPSVMLCSGPNIKRMACSQASRCPQCRVSRRGAWTGWGNFFLLDSHCSVVLGATIAAPPGARRTYTPLTGGSRAAVSRESSGHKIFSTLL